MSTNRLFYVFVTFALVMVAALTIHAGIATSQVMSSPKAVLDVHERQSADTKLSAASAELQWLAYRRGEWRTSSSAMPVFDVEQARISWRASAPAGFAMKQSTREAIRARWQARYGGTNRTCVLLCGGQ